MAVVANATSFSAVTFHLVTLLTERGFALESVVTAAALVGPSQVGARLLVLGLEKRLSLRASASIAATLPVPGTVALARAEPGSALLGLVPLPYGAGHGMMTIVRAAAIAELVSRTSFGAVNGAVAPPAVAGTALAPVAAARLRGISGDYGTVPAVLFLLALVSLAGLARATSRPRPHRPTGASGTPPPAPVPAADPIRSVTRQDCE